MKKQNLVKKFDKKMMSIIMTRAWKIKRESNNTISFSSSLRKSWHIAKNGKENETFEEVYNNYYKQIFFYINGKVRNSELAKDLTQDTFAKAFKNFDVYNVYKAKLNTWIYSIALHCVIDYVRSKANKNSFISVSVNQTNDTDNKEYLQLPDNTVNKNDVENNELNDKLNKAFKTLNPKYKQIADMFFKQELKYNEIATQLNIPMGTVKGMLNRCRAKLQEQLTKEKV
jgi:RNA polymerase sigma factor (sigma-70 family)